MPPPASATTVVSLLGLGAMGRAMRERMVSEGLEVVAWERRQATPTLADAVGGAAVIVMMLSDDHAMLEVLDAALAHARPGALIIDMGTSGVAAARDADARARARGCAFIDVPVSGTVGPARKGTLLGFAGGAPEDITRAKPVLGVLCRRVIHAGGVGQGQALKVVLNGLGAHHLVAFASMLALGERAGLDRAAIVDAFTDGAFASPSYVGKKARVLERRYGEPEFSLRLTQKDLRLAREFAAASGMTLRALDAVDGEVARGVEAGLGDEDLFALEKVYDRSKP